MKGLAKAGMITPDTIVETEEGKSAPARKVKGLTFGETIQSEPKTSSSSEKSFTEEEQAEINEFCNVHGTDVKKVDEHGRTSLHMAAMKGTLAIVRYFISQSIEVNAKDNNGNTPLHFATG